MRAAVVPSHGAPWEVREVGIPEAGPNQVLVRVTASGLCHNDVLQTRGAFPFPDLDPVVVGHEAAGEVVAIGPGVTSRRPGDRVGVTWVQGTCGRCGPCRRHRPLTGQSATLCESPSMTGSTVPGTHAEFVTAIADSTVLLPDGLDDVLAAPMMCAGYTAWSALQAADARPGDRVAVLGIGGVGHLALQFARALGFETVAVTRTREKQDRARALGAELVAADGDELAALGGVDVVLACGTSFPSARATLPGLRPDGRLVLAGIDPENDFTIRPTDMVFARRPRITASTHDGLDGLAEALALVAAGEVVPVVETFEMTEISRAVDLVEAGDVRFRAVVRP